MPSKIEREAAARALEALKPYIEASKAAMTEYGREDADRDPSMISALRFKAMSELLSDLMHFAATDEGFRYVSESDRKLLGDAAGSTFRGALGIATAFYHDYTEFGDKSE